MRANPDDFVVHHSRERLGGLALLCLLCVAIFPWIFVGAYTKGGAEAGVGMLFALCGGLFFGYAVLKSLRQILSPQPAVILSEKGILDHSALMGGAGWIAWEEIASIHVSQSQRFLCITLKDEAAFMKRQPLLRRLNLWTGKLGHEGAPVALMTTLLPLSLSELLEKVESYRAKYA